LISSVSSSKTVAFRASTLAVVSEPGPLLNRLVAGGLQAREGDRHHGDSCGRTPVLAGEALWCQRINWFRPGVVLQNAPRGVVLQNAPRGATPKTHGSSRGDTSG
jgi:hypothetical protein